MTTTAFLMPPPTPSFLRFVTQAVLIHVVGIAILNILHFSHTVEKPKPVVKVSLVKPQPPPQPPPKKVEPAPPTMLRTQRQPRAAEPQRVTPSQQPVPLPERVKVNQVTPEPRTQSPQPLKRRLLQDSRASDTLKLKDLTKIARGNRPTTSTRAKTDDALAIPAFSTIATLRGISTKVSTVPSSSRAGSPARRSRTLRSAPTAEGSLEKSVSLRRRTPLVYPRIARTERWEGTVLLLVSVAPSGRPDEITIERSSGHTVLDKAAIDTVTRWTFYPAKDGNIPIHSIVKIPIKFSLSKQS